ncbi:MAG: hypothetical protein KDA22_11610, partial [Phycisphaerales bacterium]|nr:hypothetical protein [Phycisphaerales bacterium]
MSISAPPSGRLPVRLAWIAMLAASVALGAPAVAAEDDVEHPSLPPDPVSQALAVEHLDRFAIPELPSGLERFEVTVSIDGAPVSANLYQHSNRDDAFRVLVDDGSGVLREVEAPPVQTYRGTLAGEPDGWIAASVRDGQLWAIVHLHNELWAVQPVASVDPAAPRDAYVSFDASDFHDAVHSCGVSPELPWLIQPNGAPEGGVAGNPCDNYTQIAFDADYEFYQANGSSVPSTVADIENILGGVAAIYEAEVNITFGITDVIVRSSAADPYTSTDAATLLDEMQSEWNSNQGSVTRDTAHLMTGKNLNGTTIGIAWVGVVCTANSFAYGLSQSKFSGNFAQRVALTAHEVGHNFNASHCNGDADCSIMCSGLGGCSGNITGFGSSATASITSWANGVGCLNPPSISAPSGLSATDASCGGVTVTWNAVAAATEYLVFRNTVQSAGSATQIATSTTPSYLDTSATPGQTYYYWAKSTNGCSTSGFSASNAGSVAPLPAIPGGVMASDGELCGSVLVVWSPVTGASTYQVWRNTTNSSGTAQLIGSAGATPYSDTTATPGTTYFYWVKSGNACGATSGFSASDSGLAGGTPGTTTGVAATDGTSCGSVTVTWNAVSGASSYSIWRNTTNNSGTAVQIGTAGASPFIDGGASSTAQFYWVRAENSCGSSGFGTSNSGFAASAPGITSGVAATDGASCGSVTVTWNAAGGATSYSIWRSATNDSGTAVQIGTSAGSPFVDGGASASTQFYWVRGINSCGTGPFGTSDGGFGGAAPSAPTGLAATDGTTCGAVNVSWNAVSGASSYSIWRSTTNDPGTATQIGTAAGSSFVDDSAAATTQYYWARAINTCGTGPFSDGDAGFAEDPTPTIDPIADAGASCGSLYTGPTPALANASCAGSVTWSLVTGPSGMTIDANGVVSWPSATIGAALVTIEATNVAGSDTESWTVTVDAVTPVVAAIGDATAPAGSPWTGPVATLA